MAGNRGQGIACLSLYFLLFAIPMTADFACKVCLSGYCDAKKGI